MKTSLLAAAIAIAASPTMLTAPAAAQPYGGPGYQGNRGPGFPGDRGRGGDPDRHWNGDRRDWDAAGSYHDDRRYYGRERRLSRNDRIYHGRDGRYYCRRSDGTTGLVIGGLGGGLAGGLIGGDTLGALVGAGAGALLGRSIDRGNVRCR